MTYAGLRSNFSMVLQDTWLFEGTIAENIAYGKPNDQEISGGKSRPASFLRIRCRRDMIPCFQ
ncbi:MAG: hypothetical protein ACLRSW_03645 [Christensenellaceae bacterium]